MEETTQKFAVKFRYFFITYGAGAELYLNRNNSLQVFGTQNAYTISPSIDLRVETTVMAEYKY